MDASASTPPTRPGSSYDAFLRFLGRGADRRDDAAPPIHLHDRVVVAKEMPLALAMAEHHDGARAKNEKSQPTPSSLASSSTTSGSPSLATLRSPTAVWQDTWDVQRIVAVMLVGVGLLLLLCVAVCPNDRLPFCTSSSESCVVSSLGSEAVASGDTYRGKVIDANVKASDLAAAYQAIKAEYAGLALGAASSTRWQLLSSHADGSEVSLLEHPTDPSCPYIRMTSIMPGSVRDVWDFLDLKNWDTSMPTMDPFYEGLAVMGEYRYGGMDMKLARKTTTRIVAFGKRDFTFVSVADHPRDGAWVSGTVSVVAEQIPRETGYVRAYQDSIAFYEAAEDEAGRGPRMKLTIVFRLDLNDSRSGGAGGYVPMWIYVKTVGATGMASVQNMKRHLKSQAEGSQNNNGENNVCAGNWLTRIRNRTKC